MEICTNICIAFTEKEKALFMDDIERFGKDKAISKWANILLNRINNEMSKIVNKYFNGKYKELKKDKTNNRR